MEPDPFEIEYDWDREAYEEREADSLNDMCECYLPFVTCPQPEVCKESKDGLL